MDKPRSEKLRVCAYARVSTDKDDQVNSYESQVSYFTSYINLHSEWQFMGVYADDNTSGTSTAKRTNFNRMISDARNGLIDLILTKEVSRFARNTVDTLSITRSLRKCGVYVFFVNDNINTADNDGELRLSIMATIAQDESRKTSERVKWGQKRRMEQGVVFGRDMLGYTVHDGKLYLNEEEAETVRMIFHKFTEEGKGTYVIARELEEAGICPKRVKKWSNTVILRVLRNEKYVGDLCQKKTYTPDYLDHAKKYNRGAEEKIYIRDHHPEIAIIDRKLWERTQKELAKRSQTAEQKSRHSNRYWCSGMLICGECGGKFVSHTKRLKSGDTYRAWRCLKTAKHGRCKTDTSGNEVGCNSRSIGDRTLKALTSYAVSIIDIDKGAVKHEIINYVKSVISDSPSPPGKKKILSEIKTLKKKKARIIDLAAGGMITVEDLKEQNDSYNGRICELEKKLIELERTEARQNMLLAPEFSSAIDALLDFDESSECTLHEILEKAIVYSGSIVDLYLSCVPFGIRLCYETKGKMKQFQVNIVSATAVDRDAQFQ